MPDHLSKAGRARDVAAIRGNDTRPALALRQALRALGYPGYRLHRKDLPGRPDLAYVGRKVAVFVDGAYWHGHPDHWHPETASEYWVAKTARTQERDRLADEALTAMGWQVIHLWDFEVNADPLVCAGQVVRRLAGEAT